MMRLSDRIQAFGQLGERIADMVASATDDAHPRHDSIIKLLKRAEAVNSWFTIDNQLFMLREWAKNLTEERINAWMNHYDIINDGDEAQQKVAVIMAGNIPLAGMHDFVCTLLSGNCFLGRLSSKDPHLLPYLSSMLISIEPRFDKRIEFTDQMLKNMHAVIATGGDVSAGEFEKYFAPYPRIIRRNRHGIAVISGQESEEELLLLCEDIFTYFGLGCRNVSFLWVPEHYDFSSLFLAVEKIPSPANHHKYASNLIYRHALLGFSSEKCFSNNILLLKNMPDLSSPISVVNYSEYQHLDQVREHLRAEANKIQCLVSNLMITGDEIPFGHSQRPSLYTYADGVDTMDFLLRLRAGTR